jgi:hypothetical protein
LEEFRIDDTETTYSASDTSSLPPQRDIGYMDQLSNGLFDAIKCHDADRATLERISQALPGLLKTFAVRIGYKARTQMHLSYQKCVAVAKTRDPSPPPPNLSIQVARGSAEISAEVNRAQPVLK